MLLIIASASLLVVEVLLFIVYSFVLSLDLSQAYFLFNRYIPTLIANLLFLLLLYVLFSGMMERWRRDLFNEYKEKTGECEVDGVTKDEQQLVTVRGTKEGLTFYLDDDCSFDELYEALQSRLALTFKQEADQSASIILKLGYRYIHRAQKQELKKLIEHEHKFKIERYDSQVIDKQAAEKWLEESSVKLMTQVVRSGQQLEVKGDLLLVGDVNPGGEVKASGNIYVLGQLN